jgi:ribosomal 50S subunit-recycling heat shock protein
MVTNMRIDKFLKVSRLIKRRTIAKEACDTDRIAINGKVAKASSEVQVGDLIEIRFGNNTVSAKVLKLSDSCKKDEVESMYEIV